MFVKSAPKRKTQQMVVVDANYHLKNWLGFLSLFIMSYLNYFSNGGHLPSDREGWSVFLGNVVLWAVVAAQMQLNGGKAPPQK